jgi:hypothetical protein
MGWREWDISVGNLFLCGHLKRPKRRWKNIKLGFREIRQNWKRSSFWAITPCSPLKVKWRFGGTCRPHLQGPRSCSVYYVLHADFLLDVFFSLEDWGDVLFRNIGWLSTDYTVLYLRRQNPSWPSLWEPHTLQVRTGVICIGGLACWQWWTFGFHWYSGTFFYFHQDYVLQTKILYKRCRF